MKVNDYWKYWIPARENLFKRKLNPDFGARELKKLLGLKDNPTIELPMTEELKQQLRVLAGPNGRFYAKVLEARKRQ